MNTSLETKLIECLDKLENGESVDQVLARYPNEADQLRSMLDTAVRLSKLNVQPSLAAKARSRHLFLTEAAAQKEASSVRPSPWFNLRRMLLPVASLIMILLIFGAGLMPLSASALPGDTLYGAKRFIEETRLSFSSDPAGQSALNEEFGQRRIQEINTLLAEKRDAQVSFEGTIEDIQPGFWIVAGLRVQVTDETQVIGAEPVIGQEAIVNGRTQSGKLIAISITLSSVTELPTSTPTTTATPTITSSSASTATSEPAAETATPNSTATPTSEPSPTATIQPTDTPSPLPPPTATLDLEDGDDNENNDNGDDDDDNSDSNDNDDDDDGNDNGDDDDNDNGDDDDNDNGDDDDNDNGDDDDNDNDDDDDNDNDDDDDNDNGDDDDNDNDDDS